MKFKLYLQEERQRINEEIQCSIASMHASILPVVAHIFSTGGKRIRPILLIAFARHFGYNEKDIYELAVSVEIIHSATLLHDDVIDSSSLRRGVPTAHTIFGTTQTILAGDALLAKGCHIVACTNIPQLLGTVSTLIMSTVHGEILEISSEGVVLSLEEYIEILRYKTAILLRRSCEMGAIRAGASKEDVELAGMFGEELGIAFQIVDDVLDYSPASAIGKPTGIDIYEGKITAPVLFYAESLGEKEQIDFLDNIVHKRYTDEEMKGIIATISSHVAIDKSYELVREYLDSAMLFLNTMQHSKERDILENLVLYTMKRTE